MIELELPSSSNRVTIGSMTRVALYKDEFMVGLKLLLLGVLAELLKFVQPNWFPLHGD